MDPVSIAAIAGSTVPSLISALDRRFKTQDIRSGEQKELDKLRTKAGGSALERLISELGGMDMDSFRKRRRGIFERQVAPGLKEKFAQAGGLRGSDYLNALSGATVENEAQAEQDYYTQLNNLLGLGVGQGPGPGHVPVTTGPQALAEGLSPLAEQLPKYAAWKGLGGGGE